METKLIWKQFSEALKLFILSKVKEETIADDILQEVFIKIHLKKHLLQKEVAKQLKLTLPATKSRILRGREELKKGFMECCDYTLD